MDTERQILLEEYRTGVQLYQHEDNLKQTRLNGFLIVQGGALVLLGLVKDIEVVAFITCIFAVAINILLALALERARAYVILRGAQLRYIEAQLRTASTFSNEYSVFGEKKWELKFRDTNEKILVGKLGRIGAQKAEALIPWACGIAWLVLGIYFLLVLRGVVC